MTNPSEKLEVRDEVSSTEQSYFSSKCDHHSIIASLDFDSFVLLPGTMNAWPGMQILVKEDETDTLSRPSSPPDGDLSVLDSDQEREFQPESPDSFFESLDQPHYEVQRRLSSSAPPFYHPGFMPQYHPEFSFVTMPMYLVPDGTDGWGMMRIKKKKKAGKYKKKNKMNETGGSPKAKKKNKKKLKKKEKADNEFDSASKWATEPGKAKKYKSKNRRYSAWVHRRSTRTDDASSLWPTGEHFRTPMDFADDRSRSSSSAASDWSSGSFSASPMAIRRPDWLNPSTSLPLHAAQVF